MATKLKDINNQIKVHQNNVEDDDEDDIGDEESNQDDSDLWDPDTDEENDDITVETDVQQGLSNLAIDRPPPSGAFSEVEEAHSQHAIRQ